MHKQLSYNIIYSNILYDICGFMFLKNNSNRKNRPAGIFRGFFDKKTIIRGGK